MLWTIFVTSLVLWAFGVVSSQTLGGAIHGLLAVAIVVIAIRLRQGQDGGDPRDGDGEAPTSRAGVPRRP
jgi:hypothetical protein